MASGNGWHVDRHRRQTARLNKCWIARNLMPRSVRCVQCTVEYSRILFSRYDKYTFRYTVQYSTYCKLQVYECTNGNRPAYQTSTCACMYSTYIYCRCGPFTYIYCIGTGPVLHLTPPDCLCGESRPRGRLHQLGPDKLTVRVISLDNKLQAPPVTRHLTVRPARNARIKRRLKNSQTTVNQAATPRVRRVVTVVITSFIFFDYLFIFCFVKA